MALRLRRQTFALPAAALASQRDTREGAAHTGAVIVQVPLPRICRVNVDKRVMEARRIGVVEEKRNRIAGHAPVTRARWIDASHPSVPHRAAPAGSCDTEAIVSTYARGLRLTGPDTGKAPLAPTFYHPMPL